MALLWFLIYVLVQVLFLSLVVYYYHCYHFMQGIYNYIHETNHVSTVYSVAAVLYLQSALHVMLFRPLNVLYFYISTFRSMCAVTNMAAFLISSINICMA